jgi:hypothetical protein
MDSLLHFVRWLKGLDYADLLLYVGLPTAALRWTVKFIAGFRSHVTSGEPRRLRALR